MKRPLLSVTYLFSHVTGFILALQQCLKDVSKLPIKSHDLWQPIIDRILRAGSMLIDLVLDVFGGRLQSAGTLLRSS